MKSTLLFGHPRFPLSLPLLFALICGFACASKSPNVVQPADITPIQEIELIPGGYSIETDIVYVEFSGQVVATPPDGTAGPPAKVIVFRKTPQLDEPEPFELAVNDSGEFEAVVPVLVCRWPLDSRKGLQQFAHWPTFIFKAPDCDDEIVEFDSQWVPRRIEMTCHGR